MKWLWGRRFSGDDDAADLVAPEVTVAMAVDSSREVAGTSHDVSLILSSPHRPSSPSAPLSTEDVVHQFDATHRLLELTASWGEFATFATSFGEKHQVSFLKFFLWIFVFLLFLCLLSLFLFCSVLLSGPYQLFLLIGNREEVVF